MGTTSVSGDIADWFTTRKSMEEKEIIIDENWFKSIDDIQNNQGEWWSLVHYLNETLGQGNWWFNEQES